MSGVRIYGRAARVQQFRCRHRIEYAETNRASAILEDEVPTIGQKLGPYAKILIGRGGWPAARRRDAIEGSPPSANQNDIAAPRSAGVIRHAHEIRRTLSTHRDRFQPPLSEKPDGLPVRGPERAGRIVAPRQFPCDA